METVNSSFLGAATSWADIGKNVGTFAAKTVLEKTVDNIGDMIKPRSKPTGTMPGYTGAPYRRASNPFLFFPPAIKQDDKEKKPALSPLMIGGLGLGAVAILAMVMKRK